MRRGTLAGMLAVAVLWPALAAAQEPPPDTTVPPATTVPTTVPEEPPATTVPEPAPEAEPPVTTVPEPAPEAPDEGSSGARTLTVTPRQGLVEGQEVDVRGQGWRQRTYMVAAQCRGGISGESGCGRFVEVRTDARGNFRFDVEVQVILETPSGTYDCRVAPCVIRAQEPRSEGGSRSVRLLFDPAGPDPVRREAAISPAGNLIDGQVVTVTGEDFGVARPYGGYAELVECRLPVTDRDDCDESTEDYTGIGSDGYLATTYRLEGLLRIDGADVDCRTSDCALLVVADGGGLARGALVPLDFDPDAPLGPPPTLNVTPSSGLRDGQIVNLDGEGLRPDRFLIIAHCRWGATELDACSTESFAFAKVRADGTFHTQIGVLAVFEANRQRNSRVNCRVTACALTAFEEGPYGFGYSRLQEGYFGFELDRVVRTRLRFRPNAPLLEPSIDTADLSRLLAGERWRIWGTGGRPEGTVVLVQCGANAHSFDGCALGTRQHIHSHFEPRDRVGVNWEGRYRFRRHLHLADGRQIDCAAVPCALVAYEQGTDLDRSDRIATGFLPG